MSRVYFHTPGQEDAELNGSEYEWLGHIARSSVKDLWGLNHRQIATASHIIGLIPPKGKDSWEFPAYLHELLAAAEAEQASGLPASRCRLQLFSALETELSLGLTLNVTGTELGSRDLEYNSVLKAGSPQLALAAKIKGWLSHDPGFCWFDGPDREWAATLIETGLESGTYRRGLWYDPANGQPKRWVRQGWEQCATWLRQSATAPVVLSYSVNSGFPLADMSLDFPEHIPVDHRDRNDAQWKEYEALCEAFSSLPEDEQWRQSLEVLKRDRPWAQITPENLLVNYFRYAVTISDLFAADRDERVRAAVAAAE